MTDFILPINERLTEIQKQAAVMIVNDLSKKTICDRLKCSEDDLSKWMNDTQFSLFVQECLKRNYIGTTITAIASCKKTMVFLQNTVDSEDMAMAHRLAAAKIILTYADDYKEFEMESRLSQIEKQLS